MKTSKALTLLATLCFAATVSTTAHAGSFYNSKSGVGAGHSSSVVYAQDLGKFTWIDESASVNRIVVSLADQSLQAFDDGKLVGYSNISSGKPGHETPTGTFTISQKDVDHHSNLYNSASMPFYMRLTDDGVGLHAGFIPGYPASHGCVRLPLGMARELYQHTESGTSVTISSSPMTVAVQSTATGVHLAQN
jgi:lipoprotein-anchoring transpeptidase ErfK/SrfK